MITICMLGLDQFVVGRYSRESTKDIANLYEVSPDEVSFYSPNAMMFHEGVEQTSWNCLVIVRAPLKVKVLEKFVADYLMKTLTTYTVNVTVEFDYYEQDSHYTKISGEYPRFIEASNIKEAYIEDEFEEPEEDEDECECGEHEHHHCHDEGCTCKEHEEKQEDIYLGNAFEGFEEKLKGKGE